MPKCTHCQQDFLELRISINGQSFCSWKCENLHNYRPDMTDETFEDDRYIDKIELNDRETLYLQTVDSFYAAFSGFKVIATRERAFSSKQVGSYKTVAQAKIDWEKVKKKLGKQSWADRKGEPPPPEPKKQVKIPEYPDKTIEQLQQAIEERQKDRQRYAHDLVIISDNMVLEERGSKTRKMYDHDYSATSQALFRIDVDIEQMKLAILVKKGTAITDEMLENLRLKLFYLRE